MDRTWSPMNVAPSWAARHTLTRTTPPSSVMRSGVPRPRRGGRSQGGPALLSGSPGRHNADYDARVVDAPAEDSGVRVDEGNPHAGDPRLLATPLEGAVG